MDKEFVKSRLRGLPFSSYKSAGKILEKTLSEVEFNTLKMTSEKSGSYNTKKLKKVTQLPF